jgi:hypothetical protein
MFGFAASDAFPPHPKARRFHFAAHDGNHLRFCEAKLKLDRFKGGAIFPGHFEDAVDRGGVEFGQFHGGEWNNAASILAKIPWLLR